MATVEELHLNPNPGLPVLLLHRTEAGEGVGPGCPGCGHTWFEAQPCHFPVL